MFKWLRARDVGSLIAYVILLIVLWEAFVSIGKVPFYLMPAPFDVARDLVVNISILLSGSWVTMYETVTGFITGAVAGAALAIIIAYSGLMKRTVYPLVIAFQSIPKSALAPLFVVWFGVGLYSKVVMAFAISFFPIVVNTLSGLEKIDPDLIDLVVAMKANNRQIFRKIRLPHSLPYMFDGFKIALPLALVGAIIGEFVASESGLGFQILATGNRLDTSFMFAALLVVTVWGLLLVGIAMVLEKMVIRWQPERA